QIWGTLVASIVLRKESGNSTAEFESCVARFCPFDQHKSGAIERPPKHKIFIYTGFCVGMSSFGAIVIALFLTNSKTETDNRDGSCKNIRRVGAVMAFVSCPFGVENVGVTVMTYGVVLTVFTFINGRLAKVTGQYIIFLIVLVSVHFLEDVTVALSSTKAMSSVGWAVSFAYSNWLCMEYKIYIMMVLYTLSFVSISVLHLRHRASDRLCRTCCLTSTTERADKNTNLPTTQNARFCCCCCCCSHQTFKLHKYPLSLNCLKTK
ncbi:hypothetical protein MAR_027706, partial [Mya arenaria]